MKEDSAKLLAGFRSHSVRSLSRLISHAENNDPQAWRLLGQLHPSIGSAKRIGITGPPGAGKSTLTALMIERARKEGRSVAVLAVDPVSPFTGGSLLGDRIRLAPHFNDPDVYIRSLSTRGRLGGLSRATRAAADACDAFGFDYLFIETVGVGQSEVDIAGAVDLTCLVLVPESGDAVQVLKSGVLEIADRFIVNKADRPGAEKLYSELEMLCRDSGRGEGAVIQTASEAPATVDRLWENLKNYFSQHAEKIEARRRAAGESTAVDLILGMFAPELRKWIHERIGEDSNPYSIVERFDPEGLREMISNK